MGENVYPIYAGDWILCENGDRAYQAKRQVLSAVILAAQDFVDANGKSPLDRTPLSCPICGGRILRADHDEGGYWGFAPWAIERTSGTTA